MQQFSELFWTGIVVGVIGCVLKCFRLCIYNVRKMQIFGITFYDSELLPTRRNTDENSNQSSYSINGINPMRVTTL